MVKEFQPPLQVLREGLSICMRRCVAVRVRACVCEHEGTHTRGSVVSDSKNLVCVLVHAHICNSPSAASCLETECFAMGPQFPQSQPLLVPPE